MQKCIYTFPLQGKEILNSYNIPKWWLDHEEGLQNLEKCSKNTSGRKKFIQEEDINQNNQES